MLYKSCIIIIKTQTLEIFDAVLPRAI